MPDVYVVGKHRQAKLEFSWAFVGSSRCMQSAQIPLSFIKLKGQ